MSNNLLLLVWYSLGLSLFFWNVFSADLQVLSGLLAVVDFELPCLCLCLGVCVCEHAVMLAYFIKLWFRSYLSFLHIFPSIFWTTKNLRTKPKCISLALYGWHIKYIPLRISLSGALDIAFAEFYPFLLLFRISLSGKSGFDVHNFRTKKFSSWLCLIIYKFDLLHLATE